VGDMEFELLVEEERKGGGKEGLYAVFRGE